jgi:hypothetical protein
MIYLHETHDVIGGKMDDFSESMRTQWRPLIEKDGLARVLWFFKLATGTNVSYQAISITAVRDWQSWGTMVERMVADPNWRAWNRDVCQYRRDVEAKLLLPNPRSPLQEVDFTSVEAPADDDLPSVYLHDTGWPYPGLMDEYIEALHTVLEPQMEAVKPYVITAAAGWRTCPGTGRFHEAILLSKIHNFELFSFIITFGEPPPQPGEWMVEGLKYRDKWESKLLRTDSWSPMK